MSVKEFFNKLTGRIIWVNLLVMFVVVVGLLVGLWIWMSRYTMHGCEVTVPNVRGMRLSEARLRLEQAGLVVVVSDSGYNKALPPGTVLEQVPVGAAKVKPFREIYLTTNTTSKPTLALPDIADNSSLREAVARLNALGLRLTEHEYVEGERDWVYGVKFRGRNVFGGDRIPIDAELTLQVGSGDFGDDSSDGGLDSLVGSFDDLYEGSGEVYDPE